MNASPQTRSPPVTVGLTAFNAADTIERALASASAQTHRPFEIVIVDDASTDGTFALLKRAAQRHSEIRLFRQEENRGVAAARNRILKEARGEFVVFFDDDDESVPDRIAVQVQAILKAEAEGNEAVLCCSGFRKFFPDGRRRYVAPLLKLSAPPIDGGRTISHALRRSILGFGVGACGGGTYAARPSTFRNAGDFDENLRRCEDVDMNVRLELAGVHFAAIHRPLVTQWITDGDDKAPEIELRCRKRLYAKHKDALGAFRRDDIVERILDVRYGDRRLRLSATARLFFRHPLAALRFALGRCLAALNRNAAHRALEMSGARGEPPPIPPPPVTVGLTAFNAADTIERALASASAQTWRPLEIVIVDDASDDGTFALLERAAERHGEIRLFRHEENRGVAAARNRILEEAKGEFIAFFDDDDESAPDRVETQLKAILNAEADGDELVLCHCARRLILADGRRKAMPPLSISRPIFPRPASPPISRVFLRYAMGIGSGYCGTGAQLARRSVYRALSGFDPDFRRFEDVDFAIRFELKGGRFVNVDRPLMNQWATGGNDKTPEKVLHYRKTLLEKHKDSLPPKPLEIAELLLQLRLAQRRDDSGAMLRVLRSMIGLHPALTARIFSARLARKVRSALLRRRRKSPTDDARP